ncbi:MAG: CapA family protein, partial [Coriobacteriales bacterium]|nr:CapA family protein [Coriobacteriales bacterium]
MQYLLKFLAAFIQLVTLGRLRSSRPVEGDSLTMGLGGMLWWGYKFYGHPIREPEKDSHIREYFSAHPTAGFAQTGWGERQGRNSSSASTNTPLPTMATLTFAGDVLPAQAMRADCTEHYWDELDDFLHADICCCNLESPVVKDRPLSCASENITAPPRMNNTPEAVRLFADAGFSLFSTANNHALDQGVHGLLATLDFLDEVGLGHVGTARSRAEHDAFPIREVQGIKIAFLSWTFSLNRQTRPGGREFLANVLRLNAPTADITPVVAQVKQARARGAEVVVACLHWGLEYECFPTLHQMETAHRLI